MGDGNDFTITHDGTTGATIAGNPIIVDSGAQIELDSATGIITFEDGGTEVLRFTEGNSGDVTVKLVTNAKDLIFTDNGDATGLTIKDGAAGIVVPGEVMTTKISYTDGDDAITIADGGGTTFAAPVQVYAQTTVLGTNYNGDPTINVTPTNSAAKLMSVLMPHDQSAEEDIATVIGYNDNSNNYVSFGGSHGSFNSATILRFYTGANATTLTGTERMNINAAGTVKIPGNIDLNSTGTLVNVGSSGNDFDASGITVASSADSAAVADEVSFGRYEIGAGNTVIALSQETAVATETDETKFSHKMQVRINGATYYMMLTSS